MKLDIDGVQAFVQVADAQSFHKAALVLNLTPTALSRRIAKLEAYLGVRLFDRTTRSVELAVVGREFLPQARVLVGGLAAALDRIKGISRSTRGDITIACVPSMAYQRLPSIMHKYARLHPGNRVRILDWASSQVAEAVQEGQAEFGINILLTRHAGLVEQAILDDPFMFFCRRDHPWSAKPRVRWRELGGTDLITVSSLSGNRILLDYHLANQGLDIEGAYEVQHLSTAVGLVAAGVGAAILPASTLLPGIHQEVRTIPLVSPTIARTLGLIRRANTSLSPAAQAFYDLLEADLGKPEPTRRAALPTRRGRPRAPRRS